MEAYLPFVQAIDDWGNNVAWGSLILENALRLDCKYIRGWASRTESIFARINGLDFKAMDLIPWNGIQILIAEKIMFENVAAGEIVVG